MTDLSGHVPAGTDGHDRDPTPPVPAWTPGRPTW